MRLFLAFLCMMFVTGCDVNAEPEEKDPAPNVQPEPEDTTPVKPADTTTRWTFTEDTLSKTSTTITLLRKHLEIRGTDTSVLTRDTVRLLNGNVLIDTALSVLPPCTSGATIFNAYGSPIVIEMWTGNSMEYIDGRVFGTSLQKVARSVIPADSAHNRLCQEWPSNQYGLIIAGITPDPGGPAYPLSHGQFQLTQTSILVVDDQGVIRPLH